MVRIVATDKDKFHRTGEVIETTPEMAAHLISKGVAVMESESVAATQASKESSSEEPPTPDGRSVAGEEKEMEEKIEETTTPQKKSQSQTQKKQNQK